jgi:hypothetical protein
MSFKPATSRNFACSFTHTVVSFTKLKLRDKQEITELSSSLSLSGDVIIKVTLVARLCHNWGCYSPASHRQPRSVLNITQSATAFLSNYHFIKTPYSSIIQGCYSTPICHSSTKYSFLLLPPPEKKYNLVCVQTPILGYIRVLVVMLPTLLNNTSHWWPISFIIQALCPQDQLDSKRWIPRTVLDAATEGKIPATVVNWTRVIVCLASLIIELSLSIITALYHKAILTANVVRWLLKDAHTIPGITWRTWSCSRSEQSSRRYFSCTRT